MREKKQARALSSVGAVTYASINKFLITLFQLQNSTLIAILRNPNSCLRFEKFKYIDSIMKQNYSELSHRN